MLMLVQPMTGGRGGGYILVNLLQFFYACCVEYNVCDGTYRVILRIVKAGCHPVAIAQVVEH